MALAGTGQPRTRFSKPPALAVGWLTPEQSVILALVAEVRRLQSGLSTQRDGCEGLPWSIALLAGRRWDGQEAVPTPYEPIDGEAALALLISRAFGFQGASLTDADPRFAEDYLVAARAAMQHIAAAAL